MASSTHQGGVQLVNRESSPFYLAGQLNPSWRCTRDPRPSRQACGQVCRDELPKCQGILQQCSLEVCVSDFADRFDAVDQELQDLDAQRLLLAVASVHFDQPQPIRPVLVEPRPDMVPVREPPQYKPAVRVFTLQESCRNVRFLGDTTRSVSRFLWRKDESEWHSEKACFLLNTINGGSGIDLSKFPEFKDALSVSSSLSRYIQVRHDVAVPTDAVPAVFLLFTWSEVAQRLGSSHVLRLFRDSGFRVQPGPVLRV
ncbi:hypothetical protein PTSG_12780 [Salpingoeca rosetta]|uniref:Uncharacterized protein n=1 Tax=Salpingoeca rosetta (strain ATCC 50818 / BSB-021) TaxID=946362 RepID=F2UKH8_SALR5|nr:uncharacterized protein PTSG_12780 [Salpingoeca rosetta]EGD77627.1 hypothetical protein PTSG_12780 [Salpingoeca rosetta]|eukprot:XP_004990515.1 hypothetical protein PTSG_12780 [Salpingoeca rosetta]